MERGVVPTALSISCHGPQGLDVPSDVTSRQERLPQPQKKKKLIHLPAQQKIEKGVGFVAPN